MNKRHYEHTLPNIRGSLSNTYYYVSLFCCFVSIGFMMLQNVEKRHSGYWRKPMYGWGVRKSVWIWRNGGA